MSSESRSPPSQQVGATRRSKTFYSDIGVGQDATQEQVLDAVANKFFKLLGISQSDHSGANNADGELKTTELDIDKRTLYTAFSTLYDPISRATYDALGDGMFAHFGIESDANDTHPSYYARDNKGYDWLLNAIFTAVGACVLGCLCEYNIDIWQILAVAYPIYKTIADYPSNWYLMRDLGVSCKTLLSGYITSSKGDRVHSIESFALKQVMRHLWDVQTLIVSYLSVLLMISTVYPPCRSGKAELPATHRLHYSLVITLVFLEFIFSIARLFYIRGTKKPHLHVLFKAIRAKLNDRYPESDANISIRSKAADLLKDERRFKWSILWYAILSPVSFFGQVTLTAVLYERTHLQLWRYLFDRITYGLPAYFVIVLNLLALSLFFAD
ncbi:hypothetical protein GQ42DRAFT_161068 [Ramicandelaber brevisporus]|nr:hypothetical protein GQ42DRAFT_161068 [Ramicandelaber brevisporus]